MSLLIKGSLTHFPPPKLCCPSGSPWGCLSLSQNFIIWCEDFLLRPLGHCYEVWLSPNVSTERPIVSREGKGKLQDSGKGTQAALEVRHTPRKVCVEGGAGAGPRPWTLSVGQCAWVGSGVSLLLGVGPSVPMNSCSYTCCAASVWVSVFMAFVEMRCLWAAELASSVLRFFKCC